MLTDAQRDELRQELVDRLTAIYRTVRHDIDEVTMKEYLEVDPMDESDEAVADEDWSIFADLDARDRKLAHAIEDALRRMRRGEYGRCRDCGEEIPYERLKLVPWTDRCVTDEERVGEAPATPTM